MKKVYPVCLSFPFHVAGPNCPQIQQITRTLPSILEGLILSIGKVRHAHITEKKMKIQNAGGMPFYPLSPYSSQRHRGWRNEAVARTMGLGSLLA